MQRINWFPNPLFIGDLANVNRYGDATASVNYNNHQLNITGTKGGYGFNVDVPTNTPLVLSIFVWAESDSAAFAVMDVTSTGVNALTNPSITKGVNNVLTRFTSGTGRIRFEFVPNGTNVNIADVLIETASTYDSAVGGGASGLLHGGHDAAQLTLLGVAAC